MKKLIIILGALLLSGCASNVDVTTKAVPRTNLELPAQKPLTLKPVQLHVNVNNKVPSYCMNSQNFSNMANNMEAVQSDLDAKAQQLEAAKHYYDNLNR